MIIVLTVNLIIIIKSINFFREIIYIIIDINAFDIFVFATKSRHSIIKMCIDAKTLAKYGNIIERKRGR